MKFEEVVPALRAGKKVRRRAWFSSRFIILSDIGEPNERIRDESGVWFRPNESFMIGLMSNDWEIIKDKKRFWRWVIIESNEKTLAITEDYYDDEGVNSDGVQVFNPDMSFAQKIEPVYIDVEV